MTFGYICAFEETYFLFRCMQIKYKQPFFMTPDKHGSARQWVQQDMWTF